MRFKLVDQTNMTRNIPDPASRFTILVFYPKDNTPGCSIEIGEFAQLAQEFAKIGAAVFGVSGPGNKKKFAEKTGCNFPLLTDEGFRLSEHFGVYKDKKFMGKSYKGIERTTIVLNNQGEVVRRFDNVKPAGHAQEVLNHLLGL